MFLFSVFLFRLSWQENIQQGKNTQVSNNVLSCGEVYFNVLMKKIVSCVLNIMWSSFIFCPLVKILEKRHIMKENKAQYVKRERDLMSNLNHPFFVKLYFTFQDDEKLCILPQVLFVKSCCV